MAIVKNHDFVEIEYTGRVKEDNSVFDTQSTIICVGENSLLKSLEEQLIGRETGKKYSFEINSEQAYGRKDARLLQLIPMNKFREQKIQPVPGLQLNIDGVFGVVKTVSGGRCYVDFNHPLAGKNLAYEVNLIRIVDDGAEKISSLLNFQLGIKDAKIELKDGSAAINSKNEIPKEAQEAFKKIAERAIPGIKSLEFIKAE